MTACAAATDARTMRLEPLSTPVRVSGLLGMGLGGDPEGSESADLYIAEGRAEGDVEGRFRGLSHPLLLEIRGYGHAYPRGRRQIVAASTRISDVERYRRLNDILWVGGRGPDTGGRRHRARDRHRRARLGADAE
jgi:hypothetical protein